MKRSEFAEIVNAVANEQLVRLTDELNEKAKNDENTFAAMLAHVTSSIPAITARTTADILVRSGLIDFEDK